MKNDRTKTEKPNDADITEALQAAVKALDELALERPLPPDAEHARDLCHGILGGMAKAERSGLLDAAIEKAASHESDRETDQISKDLRRD